MARDPKEARFQRECELLLSEMGHKYETHNGNGLPDLVVGHIEVLRFLWIELKVAFKAENYQDAFIALRGEQKHTILEWGRLGFPIWVLLQVDKEGKVAVVNAQELATRPHGTKLYYKNTTKEGLEFILQTMED